jgi:aerotaxis receptor
MTREVMHRGGASQEKTPAASCEPVETRAAVRGAYVLDNRVFRATHDRPPRANADIQAIGEAAAPQRAPTTGTGSRTTMRQNLPVTQREHHYPEDATLMSMTDEQSYVRYANEAFLAASGFTAQELIGQPHNVVRHPDMPREAFADMWATLKRGEAWTALVKNRRKDGDHYWVRANATPVMRGGRHVGYLSVRTKPSREEVAAAEALYAAFREGRAGSRRFHKGLVVRTGVLAWLAWPQLMSVSSRLRGVTALLALGGVAAAAAVGVAGTPLAMFAGAAAGLALVADLVLQRSIARPLALVLNQAQAVAMGHAGQAPSLARVDEIGMILRAVNQAGLNLRSLVDDVSSQVGGVTQAAQEIAHGNQNLQARTEQAASSLQQTAAAMEQMTATVQSNTQAAAQADGVATDATRTASDGGSVVRQVVATMGEIRASAGRIADIIGVIDGIAFQTNILALNAAVEAARAGEHGRGFAVVAGEVRALAQRCSAAAREIKDLIEASSQRVQAGAQLADGAGEAIERIVTEVGRVSTMISEISRAGGEQARGIEQVNAAVGSLDEVTQQNAALVEQSAAASDSLRGRATRLSDAIDVFR